MPDVETTYKGKTIAVKTEAGEERLYVDAVRVEATRDAAGEYSSIRFPYMSFPSLVDLGKAIVDRL